MATIMDLINSFDQRSKECEEFLQDLISFNGDVPFETEQIDAVQNTIISNINARLNQSQTRSTGLIILDKILPQCSKQALTKYCMLWIAKATQVLESIHTTIDDLTLACKVIGRLAILTKDIPQVQKQISLQSVKQLINIMSNLNSEEQCRAVYYYLIAVLLYQYPEICQRFQVQIRKLILLQIDSSQEDSVAAAAKCYALLAKATERSFKPHPLKPMYNCWMYNQALICNSLHSVMDQLFRDMLELEAPDTWDRLPLDPLSEESVIHFYWAQKQRFLNLCSFLASMLRGYDRKNSVSPHDILRVLCRGLAITPINLKDKSSFKEQMLYLILPHLHVALFSVLDALIHGFKDQLIPFGSTILKLFHQTLQWTGTVAENEATIMGHKSFRNVRIFAYRSLSSWLANTNSLSGVETIAEESLPFLLNDIIPARDRVLLTIQKTKKLSKKALKRLRDSQYEQSVHLNGGPVTKKQISSLDRDICLEALSALENILFSAASWLKPSFYKAIQNAVVPILYDCYLKSESQFYKENPNCRLMLLRILRVLELNRHPLTPSPIQYSIEIFESALHDTDLGVMEQAKMGLTEIEKILHPIAPPLQIGQPTETRKEFAISENEEKGNVQDLEEEVVVSGPDGFNETARTPVSPNKRPKISSSAQNDWMEGGAVENGADGVSVPLDEDIEMEDRRINDGNGAEPEQQFGEAGDTESKIMESCDLEEFRKEEEATSTEPDRLASDDIAGAGAGPSQEERRLDQRQEEEEILQLFHDEPRNDG